MALTTSRKGRFKEANITGPAAVAIAQGQPVYWDNAAKNFNLCINDTFAHADAAGVALTTAAAGANVVVAPAGSVLPRSFFVSGTGADLFAACTSERAYSQTVAGTYGNAAAGSSGKFNRVVCMLINDYVVVVYEPISAAA